MACSEKSPSPAAPSKRRRTVDDAGAAADGSTLKVPPPTQTSPANGAAHRPVRDDAEGQPRRRARSCQQRPSSPTGSSCWSTGRSCASSAPRPPPNGTSPTSTSTSPTAGECRAGTGRPELRPVVGDVDVQDARHPGRLHRRRRGLRPAVDRQDGGQRPSARSSSSRTPAPRWSATPATSSTRWGRPSPMASCRCWSPMCRPIPRAARRRSWRCARGGATSRPTIGASRSKNAETLPGPSPGA